jgi:hypothetical protein
VQTLPFLGMNVRSGFVAAMLLAMASQACTRSDSTSGLAPVVHDSSGIAIIDYRGTSTDAVPILQLDSTPSRVIGRAGNESEQFYFIRGVVELPNANLAVANGGSNEIIWFSPDGKSIRSSGRSGDGPGEFRGLSGLTSFAPDSLLAYDSSLRRFQVFDSAGRYIRAFALDDSERTISAPEVLTTSGTGQLVVRDLRLNAPEANMPGLVRLRYDIRLFDRTGMMLDSIASPSAWQAFNPEPVNGIRVRTLAVPFGFNTLLDATAQQLLLANTETNEITAVSFDGRIQRILRPPMNDALAVSASDRQAYLDRALANVPPPAKEMFADIYGQIPIPATKPQIRWLKATQAGGLWIVGWPPADDAPAKALIFNSDWMISGKLHLPHGLEPFIVSSDRVIGVFTNGWGVEEVHEYRVERNR